VIFDQRRRGRYALRPRLLQAIPLCICIAIALVTIAIGIGATGQSELHSNEGVYWQSLRAMSTGHHLYGQIFYSQPPLFLLSIYPFYELLGSTITSARIGVATLSLLGLPGAYLMGKALSGHAGGGIAAVALLIATRNYLALSQVLQAEGPATAFLFLTIGAALTWWEHPVGPKGVMFAVLCAVTLALGILIKLLDITAVVPILLLVLARIWHIRHDTSPNVWASLRPIAAGIIAAVIATLIVLAPYLHSVNALVQQVVTFHLAAKKAMIALETQNVHTLGDFFRANRVLSTVAIIGVAVTVMRRDWRIVPLLAWFLATLIVLRIQVPLWEYHTVVLIPPLIAIIALGLKDLPPIPMRRPIAWEQRGALLMSLLAFAVVIFGIRQDYHLYRDLRVQAASTNAQRMAQIAADLERATTPDQWIITDAQFVAALANRDTPPWLVDTSFTRVLSGYLTSQELLQAGADPRVHAVIFATGRLTAAPVASFHAWITEHFNLLRTYDDGIELWTR
jgi:4-amino-4-deoxy-L-arabinose transferase-like glycosyltransferase